MSGASLPTFYLDLKAVCAAVSLSVPTVYSLMRENAFPKPRKLSGHRVAWLVREIEEWAESRPISDLPPPANAGKRKAAKAEPCAA